MVYMYYHIRTQIVVQTSRSMKNFNQNTPYLEFSYLTIHLKYINSLIKVN